MFKLHDAVWGIDPIINKVHGCFGMIMDIQQNTKGEPIYVVEFLGIGTLILKQDQITKNINDVFNECCL